MPCFPSSPVLLCRCLRREGKQSSQLVKVEDLAQGEDPEQAEGRASLQIEERKDVEAMEAGSSALAWATANPIVLRESESTAGSRPTASAGVQLRTGITTSGSGKGSGSGSGPPKSVARDSSTKRSSKVGRFSGTGGGPNSRGSVSRGSGIARASNTSLSDALM